MGTPPIEWKRTDITPPPANDAIELGSPSPATTAAVLLADLDLDAADRALADLDRRWREERETDASRRRRAAALVAPAVKRLRGLPPHASEDEQRKAIDAAREAYAAARAVLSPPSSRVGLSAMLDGDETPTPWVCKGLQLCSGRPAMVIAYPGVGKTITMLSAALSLSLGRPVWGCPDFRPAHPCRVALVDFDAGDRATRVRVRRLFRGMAVTRRDIDRARADIADRRGEPCGEPFEVITDPSLRYMPEEIEARPLAAFERAWTEVAGAFDVVIVDSLRKVAPALNENDSRSGEIVEAFRRVSEATGATIILIHHSGRTKIDGKKPPMEAGRGTSAYDGAAGVQIVISLEESRRRCEIVREAQEADAARPEPWYLDLEAERDEGGYLAHRIVYRTAEQARPLPSAEARERAERDVQAKDKARIIEAVREHQGTEGVRGADAAASFANMNKPRARMLIAALLTDEWLREERAGASRRLFVGPKAPAVSGTALAAAVAAATPSGGDEPDD